MKMVAREVKSNDHPPNFRRIEVLVSFWSQKDSPSYVTVFLEKKDQMTPSKIRTSAIQKARQFLSRIPPFHLDESTLSSLKQKTAPLNAE